MAGQDGKYRQLQVNEINSEEVSEITVGKILRYDTSNVFNNGLDIPDRNYVDNAISTSSQIVLITAGSNPTTLVKDTDFVAVSLIPLVLQVANPQYPSVDDTKLTTEGQSLRVDYQYEDNTLAVLVSIDVWVADNTIDTWIRII